MYIGYIPGHGDRPDEPNKTAGCSACGTEEATWRMSGW